LVEAFGVGLACLVLVEVPFWVLVDVAFWVLVEVPFWALTDPLFVAVEVHADRARPAAATTTTRRVRIPNIDDVLPWEGYES
jgi:hypothetical protein